MWRSTSKSVTAKIRLVKPDHGLKICRVSTQTSGGLSHQPPPPPDKNLKNAADVSTTPPRREKKGGVFGKLVGLTLVGVTGGIGYAWYNQDFRQTVQDKVPYSKDVLDAVFVYLPDSPSVPAPYMSEEAKTGKVKESKVEKIGIVPAPKKTPVASPPVVPSPATPTQTTPAPPPPTPTPLPPEPKKEEPVVKAETSAERKAREKAEALRRQEEKEAEIKAENAALEVILEKLVDVSEGVVRKALDVSGSVIETTRKHTELLKNAMDDNSNILDKESQWQSVSMAYESREEASRLSEQLYTEARENLEKLRQAIEEGRSKAETKKNKVLITSKEKLNQLISDLNKKEAQIKKAESESRVMSKYKDLVNKGKEQFKKELESIMPDAKIGKGRKLSEEELNSLIAHAHRRIEQLQKQLAEQLALEQQRIEEALKVQVSEDEKLGDQRVEQMKQKMLDEFSVEQDKWEANAQVQFEVELRRQLARQTAAHSEHLQEVLKVQEEKLNKSFEHELHVRLLQERQKFEGELSGWIARLRGIETAVAARAENEKVARNAQELWLACVALHGAIRVGNDKGESWEEQLLPLASKVDDVFFAANNNPFVSLILESIPEKALTRGVYTEENLRERFRKVRKVAKRVALIDETGGSLFKFFVSYVQSFLIFNSVYAKEEEAEIDLEDFDTFQILNHANYWLNKGDFEQALRFMNMLKGESRRVASDWIEETRLFLETRQAAHTVMAFASATGLGTLF